MVIKLDERKILQSPGPKRMLTSVLLAVANILVFCFGIVR